MTTTTMNQIYNIHPLKKFACGGCETQVHRANLYECKKCDDKVFRCFNCLGEHKKETNHICSHYHHHNHHAALDIIRPQGKEPVLSK